MITWAHSNFLLGGSQERMFEFSHAAQVMETFFYVIFPSTVCFWSNLCLRICFSWQQSSCSTVSKKAKRSILWTDHSSEWNVLLSVTYDPVLFPALRVMKAILTVDLLLVCRDGRSHSDGCSNTEGSAERTEWRRDAAGDGQVPFCVPGQGLIGYYNTQCRTAYWSFCFHKSPPPHKACDRKQGRSVGCAAVYYGTDLIKRQKS